ncbi:MAG: hypothetical protein Q4G25_01030 [Paracoccus sp. (in: a-proteobacteria)]|nr:hypothetical protein [Paracoccus sp. (in: a-proteobacteria)]
MRFLLRLLVILAILAALAWAALEYLALRAVRSAADGGAFRLAGSQMLTDPRRIGIRMEGMDFSDGAGGTVLSDLTVWLVPWKLNEVRTALPAQTVMQTPAGDMVLAVTDGAASARFSPTHRMALAAASLSAGAVSLDGTPMLDHASIHAEMTGYGAWIPPRAAAAYRISTTIEGAPLGQILDRMDILPPPDSPRPEGRLSLGGPLVVWLTAAPGPMAAADPELIGLTLEGVTLNIDGYEARLWGRILADEAGLAEGELAIDSTDPRGFVMQLSALGLMPDAFAPLAATTLEAAAMWQAERETTEAPAPLSPGSPDLTAQRDRRGDAPIPPRAEGLQRIPLIFREGRSYLGALPIGPAPMLAP